MSGAAPSYPFSHQALASTASASNAVAFMVRQLLARNGTATVAMVIGVSNAGGVSPVGSVNLQPLVNQVDGVGNATPHGIINNVPYARLQGGTNAIILDPQVGDIGIVVFASRDISSVKASRARSNPGSRRRFDMADGLYIGGVLNAVPTQYVQFSSAGITITSPVAVTLNAPAMTLNGTSLTINANVATNGTLTNNAVNVGSTHAHGGVQAGAGRTTGPS